LGLRFSRVLARTPGCSDTRRGHGTTQEIAHRTAAGLDAFTGLRRGELIGLQWADVDFENLVIHVRRSVVMMVQGTPKTEADQPIQPRNRLGFCFAHKEGQATALARHSLATTCETGGQGGGDQEARCVSHLPAHVHHIAHSGQRGRESCAGTCTPCEQSAHARFVRPGWNAGEAGSAKANWFGWYSTREKHWPNWTMNEIANSLQVLEKNGGDDGTRTRGLCRDRAAF